MKDFELAILGYIYPRKFFDKQNKNKKDKIIRYNMMNMLRRTSRMFKWSGDERFFERITQRNMELMIQIQGLTGIIFHEGYFYSVFGGLGGKPNWNYMPMDYIVANPYLELSKTYHIYENPDVVIIPNDSLYQGLMDMMSYHSELLTEIEITKLCILKRGRSPVVATAPDNNSKRDWDNYFDNLDDGKLSAIFDKNIMKSVGAVNLNEGQSSNIFTQMNELTQYEKAQFFNDIGIQTNYNMKRESVTSTEADLGNDALLPLCDDMLEMRKIACKQLKDVFDIDVNCEFASAWWNLREQMRLELESARKEVQSIGQNGIESEKGNGGSVSNGGGVSDDSIVPTPITDEGNEGAVSPDNQPDGETVQEDIEGGQEVVINIVQSIEPDDEDNKEDDDDKAL